MPWLSRTLGLRSPSFQQCQGLAAAAAEAGIDTQQVPGPPMQREGMAFLLSRNRDLLLEESREHGAGPGGGNNLTVMAQEAQAVQLPSIPGSVFPAPSGMGLRNGPSRLTLPWLRAAPCAPESSSKIDVPL